MGGGRGGPEVIGVGARIRLRRHLEERDLSISSNAIGDDRHLLPMSEVCQNEFRRSTELA